MRFYDSRQQDPSRQNRTYVDINGESITTTLKEGTEIKYEIIGINETDIDFRISIDDQVTYEERIRSSIVIQTGDKGSLENAFNDDETITIQDDYIIETVNDSSFVGDDGVFYNLDIYYITKWDINTGWLVRQYVLVYDSDSLYFDSYSMYYETELVMADFQTGNSNSSNENRMMRIGLFAIIIIFLTFVIFYPKKN
ncbi:MAG: hypothetical protein ACFFAJ_03170 [Candidatus Hodarchaeota archaeon]